MPSKKKPNREQALAWARAGEPAPSTLAWLGLADAASKEVRHAAAVVVGGPSSHCVARIAARFARIEAACAVEEVDRSKRAHA